MNTLIDLVQVCGLPLALLALAFGQRNVQRSNDLQATLQLWATFRTKWEGEWRDALFALEQSPDEEQEPGLTQLWGMLDWIDWLGILVQTRSIRKPHALLRLMGPELDRILAIAAPQIARHDKARGTDYWSGLHTVERLIAPGPRRSILTSARPPRQPKPKGPEPAPEPRTVQSEHVTGHLK